MRLGWIFGDLRQDDASSRALIEAAQLGRSDQLCYGGGTFTAAIGTRKQVVLPSRAHGAWSPLGRAVVCALIRCIFLPVQIRAGKLSLQWKHSGRVKRRRMTWKHFEQCYPLGD